MNQETVRDSSEAILQYWFSSLDDGASLERDTEPFRTCHARWYGKRKEIDDEIRSRFEPTLEALTSDGALWERRVEQWRLAPRGLLALVILLDQLPRNMYRDSPRMYAFDSPALIVTSLAIREYEEAPLSMVERMFLYVPLMHAESLTIQQAMVARFESLVRLAATRSRHNLGFFEFALGYARKHLDVVKRFGRFPHRNQILGRRSSSEELAFLEREDSRF